MAYATAGMAGADTGLDETRWSGGFGGLLKAALYRSWPYLLLLALSLIGLCWANIWHHYSTRYWVSMAPFCAVVGIALAWRKSAEQKTRLKLMFLQAAQWAAIMVAMYLVEVSDLRDLLNDDARGLMMLTLMALGLFMSGLNLLIWQLCVLGAFLAVSVPLIAWVEAASVLIFAMAAVIIGAVLLRVWWQLRRRPAAV